MKTKYIKLGEINITDGRIEDGGTYTLKTSVETNNTVMKMFYSKSSSYLTSAFKGKKAAELHDDGNGITVSIKNGPSIRLNYCDIEQMLILLQEHNKTFDWKTMFATLKKSKDA